MDGWIILCTMYLCSSNTHAQTIAKFHDCSMHYGTCPLLASHKIKLNKKYIENYYKHVLPEPCLHSTIRFDKM